MNLIYRPLLVFNNIITIFIIKLKILKSYKNITLLFNNLNFKILIIVIQKDNKVFIFIKII